MIKIEEYIQLPKQERQTHLKLSESCVERGGHRIFLSTELRGLLAHVLDTTIPSGMKLAYVCHACNNNRCSNPNHIYWGTPKENQRDAVLNGKKCIRDCMIAKYGLEKTKEMHLKASRSGGKASRSKSKVLPASPIG